MLRFNLELDKSNTIKAVFQYILCYGSTLFGLNINVHLRIFQYILCYGSTPTIICAGAPLNYFNTSYVTVQPNSSTRFLELSAIFQYILCYGSTHWCYVIYIFHHT